MSNAIPFNEDVTLNTRNLQGHGNSLYSVQNSIFFRPEDRGGSSKLENKVSALVAADSLISAL